jgi:hypothetical protein
LLDVEDSCGRILEPQACDVKSSQAHCSGTSSSLLNELAQKPFQRSLISMHFMHFHIKENGRMKNAAIGATFLLLSWPLVPMLNSPSPS